MDKSVLDTLEDSFLELIDGAVAFLPKLLVAGLLLLVGFVVARLISKLVAKFVNYVETSKPVVKTLESLGVKPLDVDQVVGLFTKWAVLLIFLSAAVDVLELDALTSTFDALIGFVPNILAAAAIAGLTVVASNALHDIVFESAKKARIGVYNGLAKTTKVVVLVFGIPLAAAQLGLDLTLLTNNLTVLVGGFALAFALSFGLGGKEVASKILNDIYKNWKK